MYCKGRTVTVPFQLCSKMMITPCYNNVSVQRTDSHIQEEVTE